MILHYKKDDDGKFIRITESYSKEALIKLLNECKTTEEVNSESNQKQTNKTIWELIESGSNKLTKQEISYL